MVAEDVRDKAIDYLTLNGASRISLFGSFVSGTAGPESDLDIMVEFSDRKSLLELVRLERELSEQLGVKVDLLTESSISPRLIDRIKEKMEVIYG
jgi:predicted nucleotidyltransferase